MDNHLQHHQTHDALAVDLLSILFHKYLSFELTGSFDELSCWSGVNSEFIGNCYFFTHHGKTSVEVV